MRREHYTWSRMWPPIRLTGCNWPCHHCHHLCQQCSQQCHHLFTNKFMSIHSGPTGTIRIRWWFLSGLSMPKLTFRLCHHLYHDIRHHICHRCHQPHVQNSLSCLCPSVQLSTHYSSLRSFLNSLVLPATYTRAPFSAAVILFANGWTMELSNAERF